MTEGELAIFVRTCPTLFHMAERDSWPSIERHGLLSTAALLSLFEHPPQHRDAILGSCRRASVRLHHPRHGTATIRDQRTMSDAVLRRCLDAMTPGEWCRLLNGRVFLWASGARLTRLLQGREYRDRQHEVLHVDTARFFTAYRDQIELSPMNSGAPNRMALPRRGRDSFQPIASYDYAARRAITGSHGSSVVEVTVADRIPDIARFVTRVVVMQGDAVADTLFEASGGP